MEASHWSSNIKKLVAQRNIFLLFSALLCCAVILLSVLQFFKNERVIIVPTNAPSFWVENRRASETYLESMGVFLSDLLLNRSPSDAEWKNKAILEHVHPSAYQAIRKQLNQERKSMISQSQSFLFQTETAAANVTNYSFVVEGQALVFVGKQGNKPVCAQMAKRRYTLGFQCQSHKLLLVSMKKEDL